MLDAADPVGDGPEVVLSELFLVLHAEGAVVGGHDGQVVGAQAPPQVLVVGVFLRPKGW